MNNSCSIYYFGVAQNKVNRMCPSVPYLGCPPLVRHISLMIFTHKYTAKKIGNGKYATTVAATYKVVNLI